MFELKYDDGWYVCQNGLALFTFENGASDVGFAQWVVDALNAAQYGRAADLACACLDEFGMYQMPALPNGTCPTCRKKIK